MVTKTLPSTGIITLRQVNKELKNNETSTISLNDIAVRKLASKTTGIISMNDLRGKTNNVEINIRAYLQFDGFYYGWRMLQIESNEFYLFDRNLKIINTTAYADETADYMRFMVDTNILPDKTVLKGNYNFHYEVSFQDGEGPTFYTIKNETRTDFTSYYGTIFDTNSHNLNDTRSFQSYIGKQSIRKEWVKFKIIVSKID